MKIGDKVKLSLSCRRQLCKRLFAWNEPHLLKYGNDIGTIVRCAPFAPSQFHVQWTDTSVGSYSEDQLSICQVLQ